MAYYLMVEKKKNQYQPINISGSKYYQSQTKRYNKPCAHTLQEIDEFTMMFDDEKELRKRLLEEELLPYELYDKALSIRLPKGNTYKKVPYDFLYQKDIEYVMEPDRIITLVMRRYYQNDFVFLKKLANHFSEVYECSTTAPEVARLSEASIYQGSRHRGLEEIDKNGDFMVARMLKLLILKHYEKPDGRIDYKDEVNYRNLHDLIAFINNYNQKNEINNQKEDTFTEEQKEKPFINHPTENKQNTSYTFEPIVAKKRTRSKKKFDIEGQTSLFDN